MFLLFDIQSEQRTLIFRRKMSSQLNIVAAAIKMSKHAKQSLRETKKQKKNIFNFGACCLVATGPPQGPCSMSMPSKLSVFSCVFRSSRTELVRMKFERIWRDDELTTEAMIFEAATAMSTWYIWCDSYGPMSERRIVPKKSYKLSS